MAKKTTKKRVTKRKTATTKKRTTRKEPRGAVDAAFKAAAGSKKQEPLWKGPQVDGITQSLLSLFLVCRQRFHARVVLGLNVKDEFNHRIEYGSMWHVCEQAFAESNGSASSIECVHTPLRNYCIKLCRKYPLSQKQITHWMKVCELQFAVYTRYWARHDKTKKKCVAAEVVFAVPYELPSGRTVLLRGKWDKVDLLGKASLYLQENKTKGDVDTQQLQKQLTFDLQTMIYGIALRQVVAAGDIDVPKNTKVKGVRYNVVRRPLSGGKHSITQHKGKMLASGKLKGAETETQFYDRLGGLITGDPDFFFTRWKCGVSETDFDTFAKQFLNPLLEQLCDWWESIQGNPFNPWIREKSHAELYDAGPGAISCCPNECHWRTPYGFWNNLAQGRTMEMDEYLATGSTVGLEQQSTLFRELEED
jgi:hypothetical protein